jgi:prevent-host-death family protein
MSATVMLQISVTEASENLAQFIDAALTGEEIVIIKDNLPVVKLTPVKRSVKRNRQPGSAEGSVWMSDDFDEPLEEFKEYM